MSINNFPNLNYMTHKSLPLVYDDSLSYLEKLSKLSGFVNEMVDKLNEIIDLNNPLSNSYTSLLDVLKGLEGEINNLKKGDFIEDGSIKLDKLSNEFINKIDELVNTKVNEISKIVWFGLDNDGHFVAHIPKSWQEIDFSTDMEGKLILKY